MEYAIVALLLAAGNFLYAWSVRDGYAAALERSYFQAVALFVAWFCIEHR